MQFFAYSTEPESEPTEEVLEQWETWTEEGEEEVRNALGPWDD